MYIQSNVEAHSHNQCCCGKAISIKYSEHVFVALVFQHAKCMCHIKLSLVACLALQYFSTLTRKWYNYKKVIEHELRVLIFTATFA